MSAIIRRLSSNYALTLRAPMIDVRRMLSSKYVLTLRPRAPMFDVIRTLSSAE